MHALPYWRLSGYYFFYFAFIGAFSPYFGLYLQSLNFSAWDIGLLMSQMQLMRLFGPNLWGWLADRFGRRLAIIRLAAIIGLAGFSAFFWLDKLPGMLLAMAVLAFFWSAALPLVETLTFDHLREERGRYSRIRLWGSVGFIVAVMGTGALLDMTSPLGVLWVCWAILVGILLYALALSEAPPVPHARDGQPIGNPAPAQSHRADGGLLRHVGGAWSVLRFLFDSPRRPRLLENRSGLALVARRGRGNRRVHAHGKAVA